MKSLLRLGLCALLLSGLCLSARSDNPSKEALAQLHEFIGKWNGNGTPAGKKNAVSWKETFTWGWRFKGDDAWLTLEVEGGKYLKSGELRWDDAKKVFKFIATTKEGQKQEFEGVYKKEAAGGKLYSAIYGIQANKDGESLAASKESKNLCVVSGGAGTMSVSYKGESFYVCCSGCRDAFNENPEKYIKEFKAKKAKN